MPASSSRFAMEEVVVDRRPMFFRRSAAPVPEGRPEVVLVHGLGLSGRYMLPVAVALAARYRVFLPDLPGFGDSSQPAGVPDMSGLAEALASWTQAMDLSHPVLLGNSFGCQIIVDCALHHPDLVVGAVLQGPTAPPDERSWFWQFRRWRQNQPFNPPSLGPITWSDYRKCGWWRLFRTFQASLQDPVEQKLAGIRCPVLVVRGERDPICRQPWAMAVADALPDGRLVEIPGSAHTLVYTAPDQLAAAVEPFLQEVGSRGGRDAGLAGAAP